MATALLARKKYIEKARERQIKVQHHPRAQGGPLNACSGDWAGVARLGCPQSRRMAIWQGSVDKAGALLGHVQRI
jgi:hypothetical protein